MIQERFGETGMRDNRPGGPTKKTAGDAADPAGDGGGAVIKMG
jgi:hypothetical protein